MIEHSKPNVIYILADDMGYGDISSNNENCPFQTSGIDELCEHGIRFTDAHSSSAVCTPSRYSILTGRYNWRSKLKSSVLGGYSAPLIECRRKTLADLLREQGYHTAIIGKWHLGMTFARTTGKEADGNVWSYDLDDGVDYTGKIAGSPVDYGFDYYFGISASLDMPPYVYIENDRFTAVPDRVTENAGKEFWRKGPTAADFRHENVLDELTEKVLDKIQEYSGGPFFIYFPMPAPHTPILPARQFRGKSGTNEYGDFVLHCDDVVRRINNKLKELNLQRNTILVYTSDNGCSPSANYEELAAAGHNPSYIFRGTKADIYEGGHRVPYIVQWPEKIPQGRVCDSLVCLSDFMATMADYLGVVLLDDMGEDSVSNLPLWENADYGEVRKDIVHQSIDGSLSIRRGRYKLEMCPGSGGWSYPQPGQEDGSMPRFQLYDLETDIGEKHNVISDHLELAGELSRTLKQYVLDGRSTEGKKQANTGGDIWETVRWMEETDFKI